MGFEDYDVRSSEQGTTFNNKSNDCNVVQGQCLCILPPGHETPHVCNCGGSFAHRGDDLLVYAWPGSQQHDLEEAQAIALANKYARQKPIFVEPR